MNKRTLHRPLALLLTLALTLTLTSVPALAAGESGTGSTGVKSVEVNGRTLNKDNTEITGATFNAQTGTLTLTDYTGGGIYAHDGNLTIVVSGTNRVNEPNDWGIQVWHGSLTIQGATSEKTTDTLTIHSSNSALLAYNGDLTVKNLANLNCSSTTSSNPIISGRGGGMTFEDIGTMLVRGNTSYSAIFEAAGTDLGINFKSINTLEILNDGRCGITAHYGLKIEDCGTVLVFSKNAEAIYVYSKGATIDADRLIAVGSYGVYGYLNGSNPVDLTRAKSMLLVGRSAAYEGRSTTIKLPQGYQPGEQTSGSVTFKTATLGEWKQATLNVSNSIEQEYNGDPVTVAVSAVDKVTQQSLASSENMTYLYAWYDEKGTTPLMEAPTNVGTYKVRVYGISQHYYSDFSTSVEVTVTIKPTTHRDESVTDKTIGNGYNVYDLPAIPEGMTYGTPTVVTTTLTALETMTPSIGGAKLSVQADKLTNDSKYSVQIPIQAGAKANYTSYNITYELTANVEYPRFDLCDSSEVQTGANITAKNINKTVSKNGAWKSDFDTADEFGYTLEGWYTAPNGWGTKIFDANGNLEENQSFKNGTTYFAHWIATRAIAGYYTAGKDQNGEDIDKLAYVHFGTEHERTVYTTGLDFTNTSMPTSDKEEYVWDNTATAKKLTLTGILVNSGKSSPALTLPADTEIVLKPDDVLTKAREYYDENGKKLTEIGGFIGATATAYNNVCGGGSDVSSLEAGNLTISSESDGCAFSVRGGMASVMGSLTLGKNALLSTQGIEVMGNATLSEGSMLAAVDTSQVQTRDLILFVSGTLKGSGILAVDGDITAEGSIDLYDGATLMSWGALQSNEINLSQLSPISFCDSLQSLDKITLDNTTLELDGKVGFFAVEAENLTITNGSELTVKDYPLCGIAASGDMVVSNSTVKIENESEEGLAALALIDSPSAENNKKATLNLQRARMTAPSGVSMTKFDEEMQIAMVGEKAAQTLTIEPYTPSSSGSSNYTVKVNETKNGTVTPSATRVGSGSTVTLTVDPDGGYVLDSITAKDASGKDVTLTKGTDGKYTFKMPSSAVTVNASFRLRFTDVDPNAWYFDGVQDSVKKGLMEGMSETIFAPNGTLTRAQLVTILWRMEQQPSVNYALPFTDVVDGQWYTEAVRWAASTNVVNGTSATTFTPDAPVTREQLVAMLWRYAKQKGYDVSIGEETNILSYADATSVSEYAIPAMQWACGSGIIQGADGKLLPRESTTRAQIATIFQRFGALKA